MSATQANRIHRLRTLAWLLDAAIVLPGGFRVGLDPLIGLIPGLGDAIGTAFSAYIVIEAANLGAPLSVIFRMIGNVLLDGLVGTIPIAGDLFDFAFKANIRNIELLEHYHFDPSGAHQSSRAFFVTAAAVSL